MKRAICLCLSCILLLGLLGGCGQDTPEVYTPTGDGLTVDTDYVGATEGQVDSEQELKLTYYKEKSMNPYLCNDFTNRAIFSLLYQSLFIIDREYNVEPMLCKNFRISEDMKTYVFYPENATFSDGTVLTATDVLESLKAAQTGSVYQGRFTHVDSMDLTADGGVAIYLNTPMEDLPLLLDIPIVKASHVSLDRPMGTGPYRLEETGGTALLRRRTNWWCAPPMSITANTITLMEAEDNAQIRDNFQFSGLNLVCADPGSDSHADYRCDYELWDSENNLFLYLACNTGSHVFSNEDVRSALVTAVDRDRLAEEYYRGFARSASLPASPQAKCYNDTLASRYAYDGGEELKKALETNSMVGAEIFFLVNSDDSLRLRVAKDIAQTLTDAGLVVHLTAVGTSKYLRALELNDFDIYLGQTKLSPNMDLSNFFSSRGSLRYGYLSDVSLYTLCTEALANYGNFYTLHQAVMNDGRLCPILMQSYAIYATRGLLTGLTPARDNLFYYSLGKTMSKAQLS
ncbi:MAG: hypothetical protein J6Q54_02660 [Oscillospiraceae bacterium]|nr:hypothetical protein [Oscillospiraceae bacterium]